MECDEREGHPPRHQHLQVSDVTETGRREREYRARDDRRVVSTGQTSGKPPHSDARERKRSHERHVVCDEWTARHPHNRSDGDTDAEQMLRKGQRRMIWIEDRRLPKTGEAVKHAIRAPPKNPRIQQWIPE